LPKRPESPTPPEKPLKKLVGGKLAPSKADQESKLAQIAAVARHIGQLTAPPPKNLYQSNFHTFLTTLCYTKDEAAGGQVAKMPDYPYFPDLCDALVECHPLLIEKARRVLASWVVCAFDLWLVGGGQDPRWPALMKSTDNRKVVVASQKLEGEAGSAWFISDRIKFIYDEFEARGFREKYWPEFPKIEWKFGLARATNGGIISAIAQGADQARGIGATFVHVEELASWQMARESINVMLPTLRGKQEGEGGRLCAITTARSGCYAADIVQERLSNRKV
jgi:hypothetical protein